MYPPELSLKEVNGRPATSEDFYVDPKTGFTPPLVPLKRLPAEWELWEARLDAAKALRFTSAEGSLVLSDREKKADAVKSKAWRKTVKEMPVLPIDNLKGKERELRRARHVLAFTVQFYAQSIPSTESIVVPKSLTIPLLLVSKELQHAPYITYFDHALNNWSHREPRPEGTLPEPDNLLAQTTFTGTPDENEFHMTDIRIETKGAIALEFFRQATEEILSKDKPDHAKIVDCLERAAVAITQVKDVLMSTTKHVDPEIFYNGIRPWLMGADADAWGRTWAWEGSEKVQGSKEMLVRINGPTAGQSPLVPSLDAYLGIGEDESKSSFLDRIRVYMIRRHEAFLQHLRSNGHPIRSFAQKVSREQGAESPVVVAYDAAVKAMKSFRDSHLIIVTLYIIVPSRKAKERAGNPGMGVNMSKPVVAEPAGGKKKDERSAKEEKHTGDAALKGGKGYLLMKFLKGFRDQTKRAFVG